MTTGVVFKGGWTFPARGRDGHEHLTISEDCVSVAEFTFQHEEILSALKAELSVINTGVCVRLTDGSSLYYWTKRWRNLLDTLGARGIWIDQGCERVGNFQHSHFGIWLAGRKWKREHAQSSFTSGE
jgi:hypothetical protein